MTDDLFRDASQENARDARATVAAEGDLIDVVLVRELDDFVGFR